VGSGVTVRFICPVTRKTITTQKVFLIKTTGAHMIESAYNELAKPSMTCPLTGKPFVASDVVEIIATGSGFAANGQVVAAKHMPTIN
jgi:nitric oxide synthase-interacting protein